MESKEGSEKGSCCSSGGCHCCGAKAVKVLVLLLIGGIVGYFMGARCGGMKMGCPFASHASAPVQPPSK